MISATNVAATAAALLLLFPGTTGTTARSSERQVLLTNDTRQPIVEIYVLDDSDGDSGWRGDLLGSDFLLPGNSVLVTLPDRNGNCRVDLRAVLNDGSNHIEHGVKVCLDDGHALLLR